MNRKLTLVLVFILSGLTAFCGSSDSLKTKKVTNHFQLLLENYAGESLIGAHFNSPYFYGRPQLLPLYGYSVGFNYTADVSKHIGILTGINYFTYGSILKGTHQSCPYCDQPDDYAVPAGDIIRSVTFVSSLQIPLHLQVYQNCKRGRLVFSIGPDFYFPINTFGKESVGPLYNMSPAFTEGIHYHVSGLDFLQEGSLGFSAGLGFEKTLSKKLMIELLPEFSLINAVPFDFEGQGKGIYQNYIFNTAFGLNTYLTFMR